MVFELEAKLSPEYCPSVTLYKWRSLRTGLQVVLAERPSPTVQGYFAVASEANDDSGCPHTLEHIVFLGSKKYPYKGVLDLLGAKQMSSTNAWTAQDQTCYTIVTAGYEGFLTLLPAYLDHILNATVDKSACLTEVYHVDGNGEEKGVVFSEMQGYEHESSSLVETELQKMLYPSDSGYATNTGGNLSALRKLDADTIEKYHRDVYRPSNLSVIVSGGITPELLMAKMEEIDQTLPDDVGLSRPFLESKLSTQLSPLKKSEIREILFPDSMETAGELTVSWIGPQVSETVNGSALEVVLLYLTMRDVGALPQKFINVSADEALAAETGFYVNGFLHTRPDLSLYSVPFDRLRTAGEKLLEYIDVKLLEELDFSNLRQCVEMLHDQFIHMAETRWETLIELALSDFIYGDPSKRTFEEWLGNMDDFATLRTWSESDWRKFIQAYVVAPPKACVIARPSRDEFKRVEAEKKEILKDIKQSRDLKKCASELEKAILDHDRPIPKEVLNSFPLPDVAKVQFSKSKTAATQVLMDNLPRDAKLNLDLDTQELLRNDANSSRLALDFESIPSQFVTIQLMFTPRAVDKHLYSLIDVVLPNLFSLPMRLDDGTYLNADEVAQQVQRDLLSANVSVDYSVPESVVLKVVAKASNYTLAVQWIQRAIFNVDFDPERLEIYISRHLKTVAEYKRSETTLLQSTEDEIMLTDESIARQADVIISEAKVKEYESDSKATAKEAKLLAEQLFRFDQMRGAVIGDMSLLAKLSGDNLFSPFASLEDMLVRRGGSLPLAPLKRSHDFLSSEGRHPGNKAHLVLCAATDTSNIKAVSLGPSSHGHPDLPALTVAREYLGMAEGPYWTAVRGSGLAYGARSANSVETGFVSCVINSAADPIAALDACAGVIKRIISGEIAISDEDLSDSVSLVVNSLAEMLSQPVDAAAEKFLDTVIKGYPPEYVYQLIRDIKKVTASEFLRVIKQYYLPIFDVNTSTIFVVSPPSEREKVESALTALGYTVSVREVEVEDDSEYDSEEDGSDEYDSEEDSEEEDNEEESS